MKKRETQLPADHPMIVAWERFKQTDEYKDAVRYVVWPDHIDASLWAAFAAGYAEGRAR